jgi:hypothetical protein
MHVAICSLHLKPTLPGDPSRRRHPLPDTMDSEDDLDAFAFDQVISSDDEDDFFVDDANIISEEDSLKQPLHRGSIEGHPIVNHGKHSCHFLLYQEYFSDKPIFGCSSYFRRRFRNFV